jgi:hypothetical protein
VLPVVMWGPRFDGVLRAPTLGPDPKSTASLRAPYLRAVSAEIRDTALKRDKAGKTSKTTGLTILLVVCCRAR